MLLVGGSIALAMSGSTASTPAPTSIMSAPGLPIPAIPGRQTLSAITANGQPPDSIVDSVAIPQGAHVIGATNESDTYVGYDRSIAMDTTSSDSSLIEFYKLELPILGWKVTSTGPPHGQPGYEILALRAGGDGNQWEIGVIVSPTTFTAGGPGTGTSKFTLTFLTVSNAA